MNNNQSDNTVGAALHTPERQADETQEAYKIRRKASNEASKANSQIGQGGRTTRNIVRDQLREKGQMKYVAGSYGKGLRNWIQREQARVMANKGK